MMKYGIRVYALAAIWLGIVGLVWDDFALVWQPVPAGVPGRAVLAYLVGALLALGGAALLWKRFAALGAIILTTLYALNVLLLHVPKVIAHPLSFSPYSGVAEQLALVAGGLIAVAATAKIDDALAPRLAFLGRIAFGVCAVWFGLVHFHYPVDTASYIPKWLPPNQLFWAYATGVAHIAAGLAILSGVFSRLAAYLLTAMYLVFQALIHAPLLMAAPTSHFSWVMNGMNLALVGAAWLVADSFGSPSQHNPMQ
jgi:uncharacterized membrane protein YphA (DoxX/SURF4 family)